ncbi:MULTISPECIES: hypothetical protein [Clostridia]|uniref:DUF7878 domain-containing protein n=1 Tax=Clostridia TaxID=186801 RepID=UPI000EA314F4|nr:MULTISPECIES: hypothetical protein [Clostridia]NBJ71194.1 hypothetical protein [Roseburia sp. 1XD42-34]RKI75056.1 hypothetical protein D7V87_17385 [Clostridium sp. 1xD42-85]
MDKITFTYTFTSDKDCISFKQRKDVSTILDVSATVTIYINNEIYFNEEELPILEFYKHLSDWVHATKKYRMIQEFHYYTIEFDEYDDGAILSLIPFENKAKLNSIWKQQDLENYFELDYIAKEWMDLEERLKVDIETYFQIRLKDFMKHIPARIVEWKTQSDAT